MKTKLASIYIVMLLLFTGGCGGGSDSPAPVSNNPPTDATGGVVRSGVAFGPVDGFGSIIVNGVRYETASASFMIDDMAGSEGDLKIGQVVTIKSEIDDDGNASATEVIFDDDVEGPISSIDIVNSSLVVLGQNILVTGTTVFDDSISPASLAGLSVGDIIEVSGLYNADGILVASFIEDKPPGSEFEVHGTVTNLDTSAMTFQLNDLTVDYSLALLSDFGSNSIANGDFVEVKGTAFSNGILTATEVELETNDDRIGDDEDQAEIEGFITEFTSSTSFSVAGVPVLTNSGTEYEGGTQADLALNVRVEVEGAFNANGVLIADKVQFRPETNIEMTSTLDSVDTTNQTITLFGITFQVDANTSLEDDSDARVSPFTLNDLSVGDYLEIRAYEDNGNLIATRVERDDFDPRHEIQAFVESVGSNSLVLLGIMINTDSQTEYADIDDTPLTQTEFFNQVSVGTLVKAQGTKTSNTSLLAEDLDFEN